MRRLLAGLALALLPAYPVLAQESDDRPVTVEVKRLPAVLGRDDRLLVSGILGNTGDEPIRGLQVRLYVGSRVQTRFELADIADNPDRAPSGRTTTVRLEPGDVAADGSLEFQVDLPVEDVAGLGGEAGVHPLRIEVRGRTGRSLRTLGSADTFLHWWPSGRARSRIAWVWPLVQADDRDVDGIYSDDSLAESIAPGGRLDELLHVADGLAAKTPVTWAVDPALVAAVTDLGDGYEVRNGDDEVSGSGTEVAKRWLTALDAAVSKRQSPVLALPYADPDVVALVRSGHAERIGGMLRDGRQVLQQRLGVTADPTLAWPPDGLVDSATLEVLAADGIRSVLVSDETFTVDTETNYTPTAAARLAETGTAVVADGTLARIVAAGADGDGDRLDVQRFLAETALISLERPSLQRDIVVAPPRTWAPLRGYARDLLELSASVPWLTPTTLPQVQPGERPVSGYVTYPQEAVARELRPEYLGSVFEQSDRLARFRSILDRNSRHQLLVVGPETLDRALSVGRRGDVAKGVALVDSVRRRLDGEFGLIRIITGGVVTLTSDSGRIPLTIENRLEEDVLLRVALEVPRGRLLLDEDRPVEMRFPRQSKTQLTIDGRAQQAGEFTIAVRLLTPDGDLLPGGAATLRVRSTAYGRVALVITVGAFGILLVASATRLVRRRRRTAAAATA